MTAPTDVTIADPRPDDGSDDQPLVNPTAAGPPPTKEPFPWMLLITPLVLVSASVLLWKWVDSADKDSRDLSALTWSKHLRFNVDGWQFWEWPAGRIWEHITLTFWSTIWVLIIAVPLGVLLTRPAFRKLSGPVLAFANSGQATPAYGLFAIAFAALGTGGRTVIIALVIFTVLPVLRNTMVGLDQVNPSTVEAGRGMGMTKLQALRRIELPLAVPVILAGVRTALVINVGMAALAFIVGGGGLGETINTGLKLQRDVVLVAGAGMTAILALTVDWFGAISERILRPRGL